MWTNRTGLGYEVWMYQLDELCWSKFGVSINDLADCCYRDWYEDGLTPARAFRRAQKEQ